MLTALSQFFISEPENRKQFSTALPRDVSHLPQHYHPQHGTHQKLFETVHCLKSYLVLSQQEMLSECNWSGTIFCVQGAFYRCPLKSYSLL